MINKIIKIYIETNLTGPQSYPLLQSDANGEVHDTKSKNQKL